MTITLKNQNITDEGSSSKKGKEVCAENSNPWPFRIKLTTDHLRWDSLKISSCKELEEHILANIEEGNHKSLDSWCPIDVSIYDFDTCETYRVKLAKKESFWFEPVPDIGQKNTGKSSSYNIRTIGYSYDNLKNARKDFSYSIEPFKLVVKKRNLRCNVEIGFRWSGSKSVNKLDFSVLHVPRFDLRCLRI